MAEEMLEDLIQTDAVLALENRGRFERALRNNPWNYTEKGMEARKAALSAIQTKHGMMARVPITCKGSDCPYAANCSLISYDLAPLTEPCPMEVSMIEALVQGYMSDYDISMANFVDRVVINELVTIDIMIERCKGLMASEGTPVIEILAGITEHGREIRQPAISKALESYEKLLKRKEKLLDSTGLTRKERVKQEQTEDMNKTIIDMISGPDAIVTAEDIAAAQIMAQVTEGKKK